MGWAVEARSSGRHEFFAACFFGMRGKLCCAGIRFFLGGGGEKFVALI